MVKKKRDPETGRFASTTVEPVEPVPDFGACAVCSSNLVRLLIDCRATVPQYTIVCDNKDCSAYRIMVSRK